MPTYRVAEASISLAAFDVVGRDGDEATFIRHVGLAKSTGSQRAGEIPVVEMGPPLHGQDSQGYLRADVVGSAVLTDDDMWKITTFINRHAGEHQAFRQLSGRRLMDAAPQMYIVYPHAKPFHEEDGRYARMRFSCAGFVLEAYKKARIRLLTPEVLPRIGMDIIRSCYPLEVQLIERGKISSKDLGLEGDGPWQVLLCGYLFHALNRDAATVRSEPYIPSIADRYFA